MVHRWAMASGPGPGLQTFVWTVLRLVPFVGDFFFAARICAKERLARAPVLYLRSFSDGAAATLLARAVSPALGCLRARGAGPPGAEPRGPPQGDARALGAPLRVRRPKRRAVAGLDRRSG